MGPSWRPFLAALAATLVLAVGFGVVIDRVLAGSEPPPALHGVPSSVLTRAGVTLAAAGQPPYCGATRYAAEQGWIASSGQAGCPISRPEAIDAAQRAEPGTATEAVLARVTATGAGPSAVGAGRLAWVVVVHAVPFILPASGCVPPTSTGPPCSTLRPPPTPHVAVVIIDALSGVALATLQVP